MNESWNIAQAAEYLHIHPDTLAERARSGEIPGTKIGRAWVFLPELLMTWKPKPKKKIRRISWQRLADAAEKVAGFAGAEEWMFQQIPMQLASSNASHARFRKRVIRRATPPWANREAIKRRYAKAKALSLKTGIPHSVDHVIPLQGKTVCGLHVENNLRVVHARINSRKHNLWRDT